MVFPEKPDGCIGCPAYHTGKSFVPGTGSTGATIAFIGQGPGEVEAYQGRPFVGPSGDLLGDWIYRAGLQRSAVWITNIVQCWLPNNRPPKPAEREHCWNAHVKSEFDSLSNLRVVIPVGVPAMEVCLGYKAGEREAGNPTEYSSREQWINGVQPGQSSGRDREDEKDPCSDGKGLLIVREESSVETLRSRSGSPQPGLPF